MYVITEKHYFEKIKVFLNLKSTVISICSNCGSAPINVVDTALDIVKEDSDFNSIFCVFDKDTHTTYDEALAKLNKFSKSSKFKGKRLKAITSIPCFEIWFLFHFSASAKPYVEGGGKSAGDNLIDELKKQPVFADYRKGDVAHFNTLIPLIETAKANSASVLKQVQDAGTDNPSTLIHELVQHLEEAKGKEKSEKEKIQK